MRLGLWWYAASLLIYSGLWWAFRKPGAVDFIFGANYWVHPMAARRTGTPEDSVLRYLTEVYGAGVDVRWINRFFIGMGLTGCILALILVGNALWGLYWSAPIPIPWLRWLESAMLVGLFLPILVLAAGKWRKPLKERRSAAMVRVFGNLDQAIAVASVLRSTFREASDVPSTWAFPVRPDYAVYKADKPFLMVYVFFVFSTLVAAGSPSRLVSTAVFLFSLYFIPVIVHGLLATFGTWSHKQKDLMAYPVSVFLRDLRILEEERALFSPA